MPCAWESLSPQDKRLGWRQESRVWPVVEPLLRPVAFLGAWSDGNCTAMSGARTDPRSDGGPLGGLGSL